MANKKYNSEHNWEDPYANESGSEIESESEEIDEEGNSTSDEADASTGMSRRESLGIPSVQSMSSDADTDTDTTPSESGGSDSDSDSNSDSNANADGGLLGDGLSAVDSRLVLGSMIPAYVLAGWLLWIAHLHGLHHAPPFLWWGIAVLVLLPVGLLFGPQLVLENASSLMSRSGSDSSHNRSE